MATPETPPAPTPVTPATWTTRRGIAAASFCLGLWGTIVFWWYPFGLLISSIALFFASLSIVLGWRAGKDGEHLAWLGLFFSGTGFSLAVLAYRFMQMAFEGTPPPLPLPL
jgi:hypothetical protein